MKKSVFLFAGILAISMLASCSSSNSSSSTSSSGSTATTSESSGSTSASSGSSSSPTSTTTSQTHTHSYDEFGFCTCGDLQEVDHIQTRPGKDSSYFSAPGGSKVMFKVHVHKDHKLKFSLYYDLETAAKAEYFDGTEIKKLDITLGSTGTALEFDNDQVLYVQATVSGEPSKTFEPSIRTAFKEEPTHTFDDHGFCRCGSVSNGKTFYRGALEDAYASSVNMVEGETYAFRFYNDYSHQYELYKNHKYKANSSLNQYPDKADVTYYDWDLGQWVYTAFDNNGYNVFNPSHAFFVAPQTGEFFVFIKASQTYDSRKFVLNITDGHSYTEFGECSICHDYSGFTLTENVEHNFDFAAHEKKYFRFTVNGSDISDHSCFEIWGTKIASKHGKGLYWQNSSKTTYEKVSDSCYGLYGSGPTHKWRAGNYFFILEEVDGSPITGASVGYVFH